MRRDDHIAIDTDNDGHFDHLVPITPGMKSGTVIHTGNQRCAPPTVSPRHLVRKGHRLPFLCSVVRNTHIVVDTDHDGVVDTAVSMQDAQHLAAVAAAARRSHRGQAGVVAAAEVAEQL